MLKDILALSVAKFEEDVEYLHRLYGTSDSIEGCVVEIKGKNGIDSYKEHFCNPLNEKTIIATSGTDLVLLFKPLHLIRTIPDFDILEGVKVLKTFNFTHGYKLQNKHIFRPAPVPDYIEEYISNIIATLFSSLTIGHVNGNKFFSNNYDKGGMVSLADVKKHSEWNNEYLKDVETNFVNICKSCSCKAIKGCCLEYSATNRKKIKMIIGWKARNLE